MDFLQRAQDLRLFNFTAEQIGVEHKHLVRFIITKALGMAIKKIETPATSALLEAQKKEVVDQVLESCQRGLKALVDLDKKVFRVPPNVLLAQDLHLESKFSSENEEQKTAQLEEMKARFRENMAMLAQLDAEETKFAAMEDVIQKEIQMQEITKEVCSSFNVSKLSQFCNQIASDQPSASKI
ncbi:uncharacterized protein LOC110178173 [Drosophila serrata]|uniref:uncharacterized protein LOC110178173 n=1 Tax=Drosophila serrata TaxID=7274 RepID=UPI000A1D08C9|nr:uncharacterized protein LOC110178173 [Drosophila serrata]